MKRFLSLLLLTAVLLPCVLCACGKKAEKYSSYSFDYFDTATTITGYAESQEAFDEISDGILAELYTTSDVHARVISELNKKDGGERRFILINNPSKEAESMELECKYLKIHHTEDK